MQDDQFTHLPHSLEKKTSLITKFVNSRKSNDNMKKQTSMGPVIIDSSKVPLLDHQKNNPLFIEKAIVSKPNPEFTIRTALMAQGANTSSRQSNDIGYQPPGSQNSNEFILNQMNYQKSMSMTTQKRVQPDSLENSKPGAVAHQPVNINVKFKTQALISSEDNSPNQDTISTDKNNLSLQRGS